MRVTQREASKSREAEGEGYGGVVYLAMRADRGRNLWLVKTKI